MSKKDKKASIPKDTWRFDAKVDSAVTFAISHVLPMSAMGKFSYDQRVDFTRIAFSNMLEISAYVQSHPNVYSLDKWEKTLKWALNEITKACVKLMNPALVYPDEGVDTQNKETRILNPYNEDYPNYQSLYEDIETGKILQNNGISSKYRCPGKVHPDIVTFVRFQGLSDPVNRPKFSVKFRWHWHGKVLDEIEIGIPWIIDQFWEENHSTTIEVPEAASENPLEDFHAIFRNESMDGGIIHGLIHTPYQSFTHLTSLVKLAAHSDKTKELGITFYRMGKSNELVEAIIDATHRNIPCYVYIELKARGEFYLDITHIFRLVSLCKKEYLHLKFNYADVKVHAKMIYIDYEDHHEHNTISVFSTGNYNEYTAGQYTDYHYVTNEPFSGKLIHRNFETLWDDSQQSLSSISSLVIKEIYAECAKGKDGRIWIQTNHLDNQRIVKALREAKKRGVDVKIIVRTTKGFHRKQLKVKTVTGRFLEHGRIYAFGRKNPRVYLSSSDLLFRNLYNRFESYVQIHDETTSKSILMDFLQLYKMGQLTSKSVTDAKTAEAVLDQWYTVERMFHPVSEIQAPENGVGLSTLSPHKFWIYPNRVRGFLDEKHFKKIEKRKSKYQTSPDV